jgi:hypothetical protein
MYVKNLSQITVGEVQERVYTDKQIHACKHTKADHLGQKGASAYTSGTQNNNRRAHFYKLHVTLIPVDTCINKYSRNIE